MGTLYPTHKPNTDLYQGKLTNGIPAAGIPASVLDADFLNLLTDNLEEAIKAAGLEPNNSTDSVMQLKYAIELIARQSWNAGIVYAKGQQILHGELRYLCLQDHTATAANAPGSADGDAFWAEQKTSAEQEAYARSQDSSLRSELQDRFYPVGSIYMNYNNPENPAILLGFGTWAALPANYFLAQAGDRYEAGSEYEEGLPNITGSHSSRSGYHDPNKYEISGAYKHKYHPNVGKDWYGHGGGKNSVNFDASRCSETYGRHGDQVNPHTIGVFMWRRVA